MWTASASVLLAVGLTAQQAAATSWTQAPAYQCPSNTNNQCNSYQQSGFNWTQAPTGPISSYGGFGLSGWSCANSFGGGKRDLFSRGGFADSKCIVSSTSNSPSLSCSDNTFSIAEFQVSVDVDTDIDLYYSMPNGDTCKQTSSCSASQGNYIKNTQCGGASGVTFKQPPSKPACSVGVHSVSFSCGPAAPTVPPRSTPTKTYAPPPVYTPSSSPVYTPSSVPVVTPSSPAVVSTPIAATSSPAQPSEVITTEIVYQTTTICPVTATLTANSTTYVATTTSISTILVTSVSTVVPTTIAAVSSAIPSTTEVASFTPVSTYIPPTSSAPPANCPDVLPNCLNTWISYTGCADNTDSSCYCASSNFTTNVIDCVTAHGASDSEITSALSYLAGICAPQVPNNPGIITGVPSSITLCPTVAATTGAASATAAPIPVTTVTVTYLTTVPCTNEAGVTLTASSTVSTIVSEVTVPQVGFTTAPPAPGATTSPSAGLAAGAPAPVAAATTGVVVPPASTFGTVFGSSPVSPTASNVITPFTGAANVVAPSSVAAILGAIVAALLL